MQPFIANTDSAWFDFLARGATLRGERLDEVNFWQPEAQRPMARLGLGTPVFLRLKKPHHAIAGYGFYASFSLLRLEEAWELFGTRNGDPDLVRFLERIGRYRRLDLIGDPSAPRLPIGCTILRDVSFWPRQRWISWGRDEGWHLNIVQGKTEKDATRAARLLDEIHRDEWDVPSDLLDEPFEPLHADEREICLARTRPRLGQGAFRARLFDAYDRRCAITGEHTGIVLDAAHIQPYLGPRSNHVQNGLLLTKEFHALFDAGYVTVTPEHTVRISTRLRKEWENGHRYYPYDDRPVRLPESVRLQPSPEVLEWHSKRVFRP